MKGRVECHVTFSEAQTGTIDGNAWSVAVGPWWPDELRTEWATQLTAALGSAVTVTADDGSSGSGKTTIASASAAVVFTKTEIRDVHGFTGNLAAATSHVSPNGGQHIWIPDAAMDGEHIDPRSTGVLRTDARYLRGPTGQMFRRGRNSYRSFRGLRWQWVDVARAIEGVDSTINSWALFVRQTQTGILPQFPQNDAWQPPLVRIFHDADTDEVLGDAAGGDGIYRIAVQSDVEALPMPYAGYVNWRTVEILEAVKVDP